MGISSVETRSGTKGECIMRKLIVALALALFAVASVAAPVTYAEPPPGNKGQPGREGNSGP